jgi:surface protein
MPPSTGKIYLGSNLLSGGSNAVVAPTPTPWVRNPSWPACEANAGDNKVTGLYAVWPDGPGDLTGNFFSVVISGAYTINFGDGQINNYASGATVYYEYAYSDAQLANTDAPVTFTASTSTITRTAHGYSDGMVVNFYNIVTTTGLNQASTYYVINATANTFQVSLSVGGSAVSFTNNGTATLLPYKVAVVTITPQAGNNLTSINFHSLHSAVGSPSWYSTGWLDIAIAAPSCTQLMLGSSSWAAGSNSPAFNYCERIRLNQLGSITSLASLCEEFRSLKDFSMASTITTVTNMSQMFKSCNSLTSVPLFDTSAVTNMYYMFYSCYSLTSVPLFDTSAVTNMSYMFNFCNSLTSVPLFDTSAVTNMNSMFNSCNSLTSVPLFNTSAVTNMGWMFNSCNSLTSVPLFDTSAVTDMGWMFQNCYSLTAVPLFDTSLVQAMNSMFYGCNSLTTFPLLDTSAVINMNAMFRECYSLTTFPLLDTSLVLYMNYMFAGCIALTSVPLFNTSAVTNMSWMFSGCQALFSVPLFDTSAVTDIRSMFSACKALNRIPAFSFSSVTKTISNTFDDNTSLMRMQATGLNKTFSLAYCKLPAAALNEVYTNLPDLAGQTPQTITVTGNYGVSGDNPAIATAKGWTVTG